MQSLFHRSTSNIKKRGSLSCGMISRSLWRHKKSDLLNCWIDEVDIFWLCLGKMWLDEEKQALYCYSGHPVRQSGLETLHPAYRQKTWWDISNIWGTKCGPHVFCLVLFWLCYFPQIKVCCFSYRGSVAVYTLCLCICFCSVPVLFSFSPLA